MQERRAVELVEWATNRNCKSFLTKKIVQNTFLNTLVYLTKSKFPGSKTYEGRNLSVQFFFKMLKIFHLSFNISAVLLFKIYQVFFYLKFFFLITSSAIFIQYSNVM